jgi:hypothetical protein
MPTVNDWITSNISKRLTNHSLDFRVSILRQSYTKLSLNDASDQVCHQLINMKKPIYIGLSGGIDSEYVLRRFVTLGYRITPLIVCTTGNRFETPMAFNICDELNLVPVVIEKTETEYLSIIYKYINKKLNGYGIATPAPIIGGMYAQEHNGIFIKSDNLIDEYKGKMCVGANEWDFYNDALIDSNNTYQFFLHTPEIVYSLISQMQGNSLQKFKTKVYNLPYRDKIKFNGYSKIFSKAIQEFRSRKVLYPNYNHIFGSKDAFLKDYF